jgi:transketolase
VDAVEKASSGHPDLPLGAAPMAYVLWTRWLKHNPHDPGWFDRDRFVLSAGHGSMLLYGLLHLTGYDLSLIELERFRQWGSQAPGHPERGHTPGVEITTGPLGQGLANAVGMAIAEAQLAARYNRPGFEVIDHATYALVSDGDLMEGVASEAASPAGHLRLGKLTCLYDDNRVTLAAGTDITFSEDRARRFEAYGWHTVAVADGNDLDAIDAALRAAHPGRLSAPQHAFVRVHPCAARRTTARFALAAAAMPRGLAHVSRSTTWEARSHEKAQDRRSRDLELGGRARQRQDHQGAHQGRCSQGIHSSREQGCATV